MSNKKFDGEIKNSVVKKCGMTAVVDASFGTILSFLIWRLYNLKNNNTKKYGMIVSWASANIDKVLESRKKIRECLNIAFENKNCNTNSVLQCFEKKTVDGINYNISSWYSFNPHFIKTDDCDNNLILKGAEVYHLLDQICYRFNIVMPKLEENQLCDDDAKIYKELFAIQNFFNLF